MPLKQTILNKTQNINIINWFFIALCSDILISFNFSFIIFISIFSYFIMNNIAKTLSFILSCFEHIFYFTKPNNMIFNYVGIVIFVFFIARYSQVKDYTLRDFTSGILLRFFLSQIFSSAFGIDLLLFFIFGMLGKISIGCKYLCFFSIARLPFYFICYIIIYSITILSTVLANISILCFLIVCTKVIIVLGLIFYYCPIIDNNSIKTDIIAGDNQSISIKWIIPNFLCSSNDINVSILNVDDSNDDITQLENNTLYFEYDKKNEKLNIDYRIIKRGYYKLIISHTFLPVKKTFFLYVESSFVNLDHSSVIIINRNKKTSPNLIYTTGKAVTMGVILKDSFNNYVIGSKDIDLSKLNVFVSGKEETGMISIIQPDNFSSFNTTTEGPLKGSYLLCIISFVVQNPDIHHVEISYDNIILVNGVFDIIVCSPSIEKKLDYITFNCKASLVSTKVIGYKNKQWKDDTIYLYITPSQIYLKKYLMRLIPLRRLVTWILNSDIKICNYKKINNELVLITLGDSTTKATFKIPLLQAIFIYCSIITQLNRKYKSGTFEKREQYLTEELRKLQQRSTLNFKINRKYFIKESCEALLKLSHKQQSISVVYKGENGIDAGGLTKEFYTEIQQTLFIDSNLFVPINQINQKKKDINNIQDRKKESEFDPSLRVMPCGDFNNDYLKSTIAKITGLSIDKIYYICGILTARVIVDHLIYNIDHQLPITFSHSFIKQLLGLPISYNDFKTDDKSFYDSTIKYIEKHDPSDLYLTFSETIYSNNKLYSEIDLISKGKDIDVTNENKELYLCKIAEYRLQKVSEKNISSFIEGFKSIIPDEQISVLNPFEICLLCCSKSDINVQDMKDNTLIGGFSGNSKEILWFWKAIESLTPLERKRLLQFITGSSSIPPKGFSKLDPILKINKSFNSIDSLPLAHTCFNTIDLPNYSSYAILQKNLLLAVNECYKGFALS